MAAFAVCAMLLGTLSQASAASRSLKLFNTHTHETVTITYKKNGKFIPSALRELNRFLRDWRRNEATKMDPNLFDLIWDVYRKSGAKKPIHVVSAYRSPATNNMLRRRSRGVARNSQHTRGKAMDFYIPGVSIKKLRATGLRKEFGGVGYYPKSRSPFVHMDTGRVRHWPRMTRTQLARVFPNGKTIHVPSDGKPMPRYKQALAELNRRGLKARTPTFFREKAPGNRNQAPVQVAKQQRPSGNNVAKNRKPETVAFNPVSDDGDVVVTPPATQGPNIFAGIASRIANRGAARTPPADVPAAGAAKVATPTAQSKVAPGVVTPPAEVAPVEPKPQAQPVVVATALPPAKPERIRRSRYADPQYAEAGSELGTPRPRQSYDATFALASADTATATLPASAFIKPSDPAEKAGVPQPAARDNPADYVVASLPPRSRSFGQTGDPVAAANDIIAGRAPTARPQIEITEPLAYANAAASGPLSKPLLGREIVGSVPRPADRSSAPARPPLRYASRSAPDPVTDSQPPARAMPMIGDLRSLLDTETRFATGVAIGKFLTTSTTTRTEVFADLRHPEVASVISYLEKPQRVLKRTFGQGFQSELRTDRFTGPAVGVIRSIFTP